MNLVENWPLMPKFDLILMRNVLIYFLPEKKEKIMKRLHSQLSNDDAYLLLGSTESILFNKDFKVTQVGQASYYQKE